MNETVVRERCAQAQARDLWQHVPLDLAVSVLAVIVAAGLVLAGVMP